ncbi:MAG: helix-turn-helix domain-containing protein [Kiritimatiellales bacterium]
MKDRNIVGPRVARLRQKLQMTQTDLMLALTTQGVQLTRTAVTKLETGFRCVRDFEVVALAEILKTTPQYLLTGRSK